MTWLIILSCFIIVFCWLIFTPITLFIDSYQDKYLLKMRGVGTAKLAVTNQNILVLIKIAWWTKKINLSAFEKAKPRKEKPTRKKRKKAKPKFPIAKVIELIKTFNVKRIRLDLDTDHYLLNAYLFPIFYFLNTPDRSVRINFMGSNECQLEVSNRIAKILLVLLK